VWPWLNKDVGTISALHRRFCYHDGEEVSVTSGRIRISRVDESFVEVEYQDQAVLGRSVLDFLRHHEQFLFRRAANEVIL